MLKEGQQLSKGNSFYDWELETLEIALAFDQLQQLTNLAVNGQIIPELFLAAFHRYAQVVYDETLKAYEEYVEGIRTRYRPEFANIDVPLDFKFSTKELEFINERWNTWLVRDNEPTSFDAIHNNFGEVDYSGIELPDKLIRDLDWVFDFGKYGKRRAKISDVMQERPDYIVWMHNNTDHKVSVQILQEAEAWSKHYEQRRNNR